MSNAQFFRFFVPATEQVLSVFEGYLNDLKVGSSGEDRTYYETLLYELSCRPKRFSGPLRSEFEAMMYVKVFGEYPLSGIVLNPGAHIIEKREVGYIA